MLGTQRVKLFHFMQKQTITILHHLEIIHSHASFKMTVELSQAIKGQGTNTRPTCLTKHQQKIKGTSTPNSWSNTENEIQRRTSWPVNS